MLISKDQLNELSQNSKGPCLSLYLPTHRHFPENQQDPIRFRGLLKSSQADLEKLHDAQQVKSLMDPLEKLAGEHDFWTHCLDGLAVFSAPGFFKIITLQRPVQELSIVADSFHTKPLRRFLQTTGRYQILGLSLQGMKLFEGNRDTLDELHPATGVPRTLNDALGEELTEPHQTVASYGGNGGTKGNAMRHGHGGQKDETDIDRDRYFRAVDRAILEHHSRPSDLPLMLAALPEHHGVFHAISQNPFLMKEGIKLNYEVVPKEELRLLGWSIFEPHHQARMAGLADDFEVAKSKGLGVEELEKVAEAAFNGRVSKLMIEADREVVGRIHPGSGNVHIETSEDSHGDDLLDDLGELVLKQGGEVFVVPAGVMPTTTGAAATCRY